jgi:hypothetical protein
VNSKLKVTDAKCRRVLERNDTLCADVEVKLAGEEKPYVAIFAESKDNDLDMVMLLKNDADPALDWYDNDLHIAYADVTETMFAGQQGETYEGSRQEFKDQVLNHGTIRQEIRQMLRQAEAEKKQEVQV